MEKKKKENDEIQRQNRKLNVIENEIDNIVGRD